VREAVARAAAQGLALRLIALRLLAPLKPEALDAALAGVRQLLVVEQNHGGAVAALPAQPRRPAGPTARPATTPRPLPLRPGELAAAFADWAASVAPRQEIAA
jgi:2-oxoglutarate/2-oxoacid ferredoxin oxidoreductase subunit alpha